MQETVLRTQAVMGGTPSSSSSSSSSKDKHRNHHHHKSSSRKEKKPSIHRAASRGDYDQFVALIEAGKKPEKRGKHNATPLHVASFYDREEIVKYLISLRVDLNAADSDGSSPVQNAAFSGSYASMRQLVKAGADLGHRDADGSTALHKAAFSGKHECLKYLIRNGAVVNVVDETHSTPLHHACANGYIESVEYLIKKDANVNAIADDQCTPLHRAIAAGHPDCVESLLKNNADASIADSMGAVPLHYAAEYGFLEIATLMASKGSLGGLNVVDMHGHSALDVAASMGHFQLVEMLCKKGANLVNTGSTTTALHEAAMNGQTKVIESLLEVIGESKIDVKDVHQATALHRACETDQLEAIRYLISRGALLTSVDKKKRTPLHYAAKFGHARCVHELIVNGAGVDSPDCDSCSPLILACKAGATSCVEILSNKANLNARDLLGSPLHHASMGGHDAIVKILVNKGADVMALGSRGVSALHCASAGPSLDVLSVLLDALAELPPDGDVSKVARTSSNKYGLSRRASVNFIAARKADSLNTHSPPVPSSPIRPVTMRLSPLSNSRSDRFIGESKGTASPTLPISRSNQDLSSRSTSSTELTTRGSLSAEFPSRSISSNSISSPPPETDKDKDKGNRISRSLKSLTKSSPSSQSTNSLKPPISKSAGDTTASPTIIVSSRTPSKADSIAEIRYNVPKEEESRSVPIRIINMKDEDGRTPIQYAIKAGRHDNIQMLILEGAEISGDVMREVTKTTDKDSIIAIINYRDSLKKKEHTIAAQEFNKKPKKGIQYLKNIGFETTESISKFLYSTPAVSKRKLGEYLGEPDPESVKTLESYIEQFEFAGLSLDKALRLFLSKFWLPGEAQKIDRFMELFSKRFCNSNPGLFANVDTAYVLAFSIIMLNTDAHNPAIKKESKMSLSQFRVNTARIPGIETLPKSYLEEVYNSIVTDEIHIESEGSVFCNVEKKGWLTKQGGRIKTWKTRWFLLSGNVLYYFKQPTDTEPLGMIPLENVSVRPITQRKKFCFELYTNPVEENEQIPKHSGTMKGAKYQGSGLVQGHHENYVLSAESKEAMEQWISSIKNNIFHNPLADLLKKRSGGGLAAMG